MKNTSKKIQPWTKKDVVKNVFTYIGNYFVLLGLFLLAIYANDILNNGKGFIEYLTEAREVIFVAVLTAIMVVVMAVYFFLKIGIFLKKPPTPKCYFS